MHYNPGTAFISTGVGHCIVGLLVPKLRTPLLEIISAGVINSVVKVHPLTGEPTFDRSNSFWFQFGGVVMVAMGRLMQLYLRDVNGEEDVVRGKEVVKASECLPEEVGWWFLGIGVGGGLMLPVSGFWLLVPQGLYVVWRARQHNKAKSA
ncbi:hypothetical protein HK097_008009 [Rhizophlyctis rosea]|uniref:Uncharacterized protein n=1 Tax=Rhizophlyctis rosea TaxID=64517 RepID=A0AAD5SAW9_9FUNG|nr:hypothetical protein HK097_008009 [Rhizophlyctis rosea]